MYVSYVLINDIHIQTYSVIIVIVHECLCFDEHVRYIKPTAICAQRMYLIKRLCDQGLTVKQVNIVFESLVDQIWHSRLGRFYITAELRGTINAVFLRPSR